MSGRMGLVKYYAISMEKSISSVGGGGGIDEITVLLEAFGSWGGGGGGVGNGSCCEIF